MKTISFINNPLFKNTTPEFLYELYMEVYGREGVNCRADNGSYRTTLPVYYLADFAKWLRENGLKYKGYEDFEFNRGVRRDS